MILGGFDMMPGVPAMGHVARGYWHPGKADGCPKCEAAKPRTFVVRKSDIDRCPRHSLSPHHYRNDGSCKCPTEEGEK